MIIKAVTAEYKKQTLIEFMGNPLIEALPETMELNEMALRVSVRPPYDETNRTESIQRRLEYTERLRHFHQPVEQDIIISSRIDNCIRWGYASRNPMQARTMEVLSTIYGRMPDEEELKYLEAYHPNTPGFSIVGVSGVGKSTSVESALTMYPQVINHTSYNDRPFILSQVVWLKIDCTHDGTLKGLCLDFFKEFDRIAGTDYQQHLTNRISTERMIMMMTQAARSHSLGLLIVDEIQHLSISKSGGAEKMLNFFVTLSNRIGIPVLLIGTPAALKVLQGNFRQARRAEGQGSVLWKRMENDDVWTMFAEAMWDIQYTQEHVILSKAMKDVFYDETQGIAFLAVTLYKLVQEDAILSGRETFDEDDVRRVASECLSLTEPMKEALKTGNEIDLKRYEDIHSFSYRDYMMSHTVSKDASDVAVNKEEKHFISQAHKTLMGLGIGYKDAEKLLCEVAVRHPDEASSASIAVMAYQLWLEKHNSKKDVKTVSDKNDLRNVSAYEVASEIGGIIGGQEDL